VFVGLGLLGGVYGNGERDEPCCFFIAACWVAAMVLWTTWVSDNTGCGGVKFEEVNRRNLFDGFRFESKK
jgi:hypothetical protein